ncbi:MAG: hypothetical protein ACTSPY_07415 [Candidatus Helarchaeota archaeon]
MDKKTPKKKLEKNRKGTKEEKNDKGNLEIEKDLRYWIYRGIGIGGGVIAIITLFLPWFQVIGSSIITITPIYVYYNGIFIYFWDYYTVMGINESLLPIIIMMDICFALIILSSILCLLTISRAPSSILMILICLTFIAFSVPFIEMGVITGYFPFFGATSTGLWGFSSGWFLTFLAFILSMFFRKLKTTQKDEFRQEWKQKISEMQD